MTRTYQFEYQFKMGDKVKFGDYTGTIVGQKESPGIAPLFVVELDIFAHKLEPVNYDPKQDPLYGQI